jgi:hypothetical protein
MAHTRPSHRHFIRRLFVHFLYSLAWLVASLLIGMWGYEHFEHMRWRDAFVNSAMLLGGMGPVEPKLSEPGKVFAGVYALYCGLVVIGVTGLLADTRRAAFHEDPALGT